MDPDIAAISTKGCFTVVEYLRGPMEVVTRVGGKRGIPMGKGRCFCPMVIDMRGNGITEKPKGVEKKHCLTAAGTRVNGKRVKKTEREK